MGRRRSEKNEKEDGERRPVGERERSYCSGKSLSIFGDLADYGDRVCNWASTGGLRWAKYSKKKFRVFGKWTIVDALINCFTKTLYDDFQKFTRQSSFCKKEKSKIHS